MLGLTLERRGPVLLITLNRPKSRNALDAQLIEALSAAFADLKGDGEVRAVVLAAAGAAWCLGLDLDGLADGGRALGLVTAIDTMRSAPQPIIAAIQGPATTGGLELALACDIRLGTHRARFADLHARVGIHPGWGLTAALPRVVGPSFAREMSFTGRVVSADEALARGLLNRIVPRDRLLDEAMNAAVAIAEAHPETLRAIRSLYDDDGFGGALIRERKSLSRWLAGRDIVDAVRQSTAGAQRARTVD